MNTVYGKTKIFDSGLVAIRKNKFTLILNKSTYVGICILCLSEVLIYELNCDYIKNKYDNN